MDITWEEFQAIAPHLDELTQLRVMNAVLELRLAKQRALIEDFKDQVIAQKHTIERLEADVRTKNGVNV